MADNEKEPTEVLRWGLTHEYVSYDYQCIKGFTTERMEKHTAKGEVKGKDISIDDQR